MDFSAEVLKIIETLSKTLAGRQIADQLLRSSMSVGANVQEARSAESRADFVHKMQISLKEIREANYWLTLILKAKLIDNPHVSLIAKECEELTAILAKSVITAKRNGISETNLQRSTHNVQIRDNNVRSQ